MDYIRFIRKHVGQQEIFMNFAGGWIENSNGILLERRRDSGEWGLIGGAMELGESAKDTAQREIFEETGLHAEIGELVGVYTKYRSVYANGDKLQTIVLTFYATVDESLAPKASNESFEVTYFPRDHVPELGILQHRDIANDALAGRTGMAR